MAPESSMRNWSGFPKKSAAAGAVGTNKKAIPAASAGCDSNRLMLPDLGKLSMAF